MAVLFFCGGPCDDKNFQGGGGAGAPINHCGLYENE